MVFALVTDQYERTAILRSGREAPRRAGEPLRTEGRAVGKEEPLTLFDEELAVRGTTPAASHSGSPASVSAHAEQIGATRSSGSRPGPAPSARADAPGPVPPHLPEPGDRDVVALPATPLPRGTGGGRRPMTLPPRVLAPLLVLAVAVLVTGVVLGEGLLLAAGLVLAGTVVNLIGKPRS